MKTRNLFFLLGMLSIALVFAPPAYGQDDAVRVSTAGVSPIMVESKTEPGAYFISYQRQRYGKDTTVNAFSVYMQKMKNGALQWAQEIKVTNTFTGSMNFRYKMIGTADGGCAMLYYGRKKWSEDPLNIYVYKIKSDGTKMWEHQLSTAETVYRSGYDPTGDIPPTVSDIQTSGSPRLGGDLVELPGGEIVITWFNEHVAGAGLYNIGGMWIATIAANGSVAKAEERLMSGTVPCMAIDPANPSQFFLTYGSGSGNALNINMNKYSMQSNGTFTKLWSSDAVIHNNTLVYTMNDVLRAVPDGEGGAFAYYQAKRSAGTSASNVYLQQVNSAGKIRWTAPGLVLAQNSRKSYMVPIVYYYKPRETMLVAWREGSASQSNFSGIGMQRVDLVSGELEWGIAGKSVVEPTYNLTIECLGVSLDAAENPSYLYGRGPLGSLNTSAILLKKLDLNGFEDVAPADKTISPVSQKLNHTMLFSGGLQRKGIVVWVDKKITDSEGIVYAKEFTY